MSTENRVLVVGAGSAGAAAALFLASKGVAVDLVEARKRDNAGAGWINGVETSLFAELDLPAPPKGVQALHARRFRIFDPSLQSQTVVENPPLAEIDMRALNAWLLDLCDKAGVNSRFGARATIGDVADNAREVRIRNRTERYAAIIDASGLTAQAAASFNAPIDLCSAYQAVYEVRHSGQARDYIGRLGARDLETISVAGVEGGYSVRNVCLFEEGSKVAVLTGAMYRPALRSGARIASDFVKSQPWIGPRLFGGGGLIPLRALDHCPVDDRLVRIGNAAGQVFPQHGSGVAVGMRAAWHAAHAISAALQIGELDARGLWSYARNVQTGVGAMNAHYQPLRYLAQSFTPAEAKLLIDADIISAKSVAHALEQRLAGADVATLFGSLRHARALLPMVPRLATAGAIGVEMLRHWKAFPERGPGPEYDSWARRAERLFTRAAALTGYVATAGQADEIPDRNEELEQ